MFGIHFKHSLIKSGILHGATDIHCHVLPGVDDGSPDMEHSHDLLRFMEQVMGYSRVWLTPHVMQGLDNDSQKLRRQFEMFCQAQNSQLKLCLAAEYMMDAEFSQRLHAAPLPLGNGHLLVETSYMSAPLGGLDNLLLDVWRTGLTPIIAHPERYMYMDEADYHRLRDKGYEFQLNLLSLSGYYGGRPKVVAERLLQIDAYDYVGSDLHHVERFERFLTNMKLTREQLDSIAQLLDNNKQLTDEAPQAQS